jgi:RNA polymerase sigma-70 factor (ECF subfamily)
MTASEQQAALDRYRQGDARARGELLESFRPYVRLLVRALHDPRLRARLDESDLIQDAMLEALQHFDRFTGGTTAELAAWLRTVVRWTALRTLRGHRDAGKRAVGREQGVENLADSLADGGASPSAETARHELAAQLARCLARLPDDMQQVLLGRHMDGLPYAVLAERLGRSEGAVRVLYTRALRRLRDECQGGKSP